jgi:hypothetical protein
MTPGAHQQRIRQVDERWIRGLFRRFDRTILTSIVEDLVAQPPTQAEVSRKRRPRRSAFLAARHRRPSRRSASSSS